MSCGDWICNDGFVLWLTVLITATKLMAIRLWEGYSHYIPGRSFRSPEITGTGSSIPVEKRWDFSQQIPINFLCFPTRIGQNLSEKFRSEYCFRKNPWNYMETAVSRPDYTTWEWHAWVFTLFLQQRKERNAFYESCLFIFPLRGQTEQTN